MDVLEALRNRRSIRAFKPDPVSRETVLALLQDAALSPSGTNVQPWKVHVVAGDVRQRLEREVMAHRETNPPDANSEFERGDQRREPYLSRSRTLGKAMYGLLGIPKGDQAANWAQWGRNYQFFDAPIGLIFTIDRELGRMKYVDCGIFMQSLMLAATARGLDTCAQGAWGNYWSVTRRVLNVPDDEVIFAGMSLGYADPDAPVNTLVAGREAVENFAVLHGFED